MSKQVNAAAILGAKGGAAKSPAKTAAARANGAKGGRPVDHAGKIISILWSGEPYTEKGGSALVDAVRAVPVDRCLEVRRRVIDETKGEAWRRSMASSTDLNPSPDPRPWADPEMNAMSAQAGRERRQAAEDGREYRYIVEEALRVRAGGRPSLGCMGHQRELLERMLDAATAQRLK